MPLRLLAAQVGAGAEVVGEVVGRWMQGGDAGILGEAGAGQVVGGTVIEDGKNSSVAREQGKILETRMGSGGAHRVFTKTWHVILKERSLRLKDLHDSMQRSFTAQKRRFRMTCAVCQSTL